MLRLWYYQLEFAYNSQQQNLVQSQNQSNMLGINGDSHQEEEITIHDWWRNKVPCPYIAMEPWSYPRNNCPRPSVVCRLLILAVAMGIILMPFRTISLLCWSGIDCEPRAGMRAHWCSLERQLLCLRGGFDFSIGKNQFSSAGLLLCLAGRISCENDKACRLLANKGMSTFDSLQEVDYGGNVPNPVKYWTEIDDGSPDRSSDPYNQAQFMG